jgi:hypothetical protein
LTSFKSITDSDDVFRLAESYGRRTIIGTDVAQKAADVFLSKYVVLVIGFLFFTESMIVTDFAEDQSLP